MPPPPLFKKNDGPTCTDIVIRNNFQKGLEVILIKIRHLESEKYASQSFT